MIIVSQKKNRIFNFNNITEIYKEKITEFETTQTRNITKNDIGKYVIRVTTVTPYMIGEICTPTIDELGIYETEERAKEVLQEITDTYKFNICIAVGQKNAVYQMPEG